VTPDASDPQRSELQRELEAVLSRHQLAAPAEPSRETVHSTSATRAPVGFAPLHVLYGGAHLFRPNTPPKLAAMARTAMSTWGSDPIAFARAIGLAEDSMTRALPSPEERHGVAFEQLAHDVAARVRTKLEHHPIERLCIDFEDGYGPRPDDEEDADASRTGEALAEYLAGARTHDAASSTRAPHPTFGIRIKALAIETAPRAIRTLHRFIAALVSANHGTLPPGFTVTLPKVTHVRDVEALAELLATLERSFALPPTSIGIELMVESPLALVAADGRVPLGSWVAAADGRCVAAHLGAYDLLSSLGVAAHAQRLAHPFCDAARCTMQLSLSPLNVRVVDGATTILPIPSRSAPETDAEDAQRDACDQVHDAWREHARGITHALEAGIYQGWDLHPAQVPARYGAVFAFFAAARPAMTSRLAAFVERATQAMRSGRVFDDAATAQGIVNFFVQGAASGALSEADVHATGLTLDELRTPSFSFAEVVARRARPAKM